MSVDLIGSLKLRLDEERLKATLIYTPSDGEGPIVDQAQVKRCLSENGVREGISSSGISNALDSYLKANQFPAEFVIALGNPPESPVPASVTWYELSINDDLVAIGESLFKKVGDPVIEKKVFDKVKVQKKVLKKNKLPFLPPKEEIVTVVEKRERYEPVAVDPTRIGMAYVRKDQKLGQYIPEIPGKPGKNVLGMAIPAALTAEDSFIPGKGVSIQKGNIIAESPGFLRWGHCWCDIVPFSRHRWDVYLSKDNSTCYIDFYPGSVDDPLPDTQAIMDKANKLGYRQELLLPSEVIITKLMESIESEEPLIKSSLSDSDDSRFEIYTDDDRMTAYLMIQKGRGNGKPLVLKDVGSAIKESGLIGLNFNQIKEDILSFYKGPEVRLDSYKLAVGVLPESGSDSKIELNVKILDTKEFDELKKRISTADFSYPRELPSLAKYPVNGISKMALVKEGEIIAEITKGKKGKPGKDVFGHPIEVDTNDKFHFETHENIEIAETRYIAEITGILDLWDVNGVPHARVRPHEDAETEVFVSDDKMKAYMSLRREMGCGAPLFLEDVHALIKEKGITKGLNEPLIEDAFHRARKGVDISHFLIAEGMEPVAMGQTELIFQIESNESGENRQSNVKIDKSGKADYKGAGTIASVKVGDIIAKVMPSTVIEKAGWNIHGKEIPAPKAVPLSVQLGKNIREEKNENGEIDLVAEKNGELIREKSKLEIRACHRVAGNVDMKTGSIRFPGEVQITGSVLPGFFVMAGGNVHIGENAESSLVSSDESVIIKQGIRGQRKGVIRSKGKIHGSFAEQATLLSVDDIVLKNSSLQCRVKCNGKMALLSERGNLVGGSIKVRHGLDVMNLGSESGTKTEVYFGQDFLFEDQIESEERQISHLRSQVAKLDILMAKLEQQKDKRKLYEARRQKLISLKKVEQRSMRLLTLREKYEEHFESEIRIRGQVFPGVVIHSHGRVHEIIQPKKSIIIYFNKETGHIQEKPIEK